MDAPLPPPPTPPASFDSIIVPPEPPPAPPSQQEKSIPPQPSGSGVKIGKKVSTGPIIATLLFLLITLPLSIMFIANRNQLSDVRSRADELYPTTQAQCQAAGGSCNTASDCTSRGGTERGTCNEMGMRIVCCMTTGLATCPAIGGTCSPAGAECDAGGGKGNYCCVKVTNGYSWQPKTWATCPTDGVVDCPWTETNGKCCPSSVDACDYTAGGVKCIGDPFNSHCQKWGDGTCPGGGGRWAGVHYYTDCTTEGCGNDSRLTCVTKADGKQNLCRNSACPSDTDCECGGTPPDTISPTPGGKCKNITVYKDDIIVSDLDSLKAGAVIIVAVQGENATQARVRYNGSDFELITEKNASGEYRTQPFTIPADKPSITIESEVFVNGEWK